MNRKEFLADAAHKIPEHLRPLTEDHLRHFIEIGLVNEPLHAYDFPKVSQLLGMLHSLQPQEDKPTWPTSMPEIHHVVDCSPAEDPVSAAAMVKATREWMPAGDIYVNFTELGFRTDLAGERLKWANLAHLMASKAAEMGDYESPEAARKRAEEIMQMAPELGAGATKMDIAGLPRNSLLYSWYVLPDGSLVPRVERAQPVDYRYVHRLVAKVLDGQITAIELLFGIGFGGLTRDETRTHQKLIEHTLAHPRELDQGKALVANYSTFLATWPEAIRLHDSVMVGESSRYVVVRRFASWIDYTYYCLAGEIAGVLAGHSKILVCEYCGSTLGSSGHRDRRFCLKTENPACVRARDGDSKRRRRALSS